MINDLTDLKNQVFTFFTITLKQVNKFVINLW
jgi:hypothetical protein